MSWGGGGTVVGAVVIIAVVDCPCIGLFLNGKSSFI